MTEPSFQRLAPGKPLVKELKGKESQAYQIALKRNQFMHVRVDQQGIDVVVSLYGPEGTKLAERDSPNGNYGVERLSWIAGQKGTFRLEVHSLDKNAKQGRYEISLVEFRQSGPQDQTTISAEAISSEAQHWQEQKETASRQTALVKYQQASEMWHRIGDTYQEAMAIEGTGTAFKHLGEDQKALAAYKQSLLLYRFSQDRPGEAHALNNIGGISDKIGDKPKALEAILAAADIFRELSHAGDEAESIDQAGAIQEELKKLPEAIGTYQRLLILQRSMRDKDGEAQTLRILGRIYRLTAQPQKSIESYSQVLTIYQNSSELLKTAAVLYSLGLTYKSSGDKQKALASFNQALGLMQTRGQPSEVAAVRAQIGDVNYQLHQTEIALDNYQKALALYADSKKTKEFVEEMGELQESIALCEKEIQRKKDLAEAEKNGQIAKAGHDYQAELVALNKIGPLELAQKNSQRALEIFTQALRLARANNDKAAEAQVLGKIGLIHLRTQRKAEAIDELKLALKINQQIGDHRREKELVDDINLTDRAVETPLVENGKTNKNLLDLAGDVFKEIGDLKGQTAVISSYVQEMWIGEAHLELLFKQNLLLIEALEVKVKDQKLTGFADYTEKKKDALRQLALFYYARENWQQSLEHYQRLLQLEHDKGDRKGEAATLTGMALIYDRLTQYQTALEYGERARALDHELADQLGESDALVGEGMIHNRLGERLKALELYGQALALAQEAKDQNRQYRILFRIGESNYLLGEKQKALENLQKALALSQTKPDAPGDSRILDYIGLVYASLGDKQKEHDYFIKSLPNYQRDLAVARASKKSLKEMFEQSKRGDSFERRGMQSEETALISLGEAYYRLEMNREAIQTFNEALPLVGGMKDIRSQAFVLNRLGLLYHAQGEKQKALEAFTKALELHRTDGNRGRQGEVIYNLGTVHEGLGEKLKAQELYIQSLAIRREVKDLEGEGDTLNKLMLLWKSLGKSRLAIFYGKQAVNTFQQIRSNIHGLDKQLQASFLRTREDAYRQLADLLVAEGRLPEAQQVLTLVKEQEYYEFVRRDAKAVSTLLARTDLRPEEEAALKRYDEIADHVTEYAQELSALKAQGVTPDEPRYQKLAGDLEAANRSFQVFLRQLEDEFGKTEMASVKRRELQENKGLQSDLKRMGPGVVSLYTIISPENYRVILTTPINQVVREASPRITGAELNKLVFKFKNAVQDPCACVDPRPLGQELYKILLGPVAADLAAVHAKTLIWSLDGVLRYVPLSALYDEVHGQYVVERYQNVIITLASRTRLGGAPASSWRGLGLGVSKGVEKEWGSFEPLPKVPAELRGIIHDDLQSASATSLSPGVLPGKVLLDDEFTEKTMMAALSRAQYPIVHIASHFFFKPGNETNSFLLLGDGNRLTLDQIRVSATPFFDGVELLTLSACNTATGGTSSNGREVEGFAVLAQEQGAQSVLATLWPVADESTKILMQNFYEGRFEKTGITKADALQQAQLSLLHGQEKGSMTKQVKKHDNRTQTPDEKNDGTEKAFQADANAPYAHPYYWGPFILIGNWR